MKFIHYIILAICNTINFISHLIFYNSIIIDRDTNMFLISKLLNNDEQNNKNEILAQLEILEILEEDYDFLIDLEKMITIPADLNSIRKWENLTISQEYTDYGKLSEAIAINDKLKFFDGSISGLKLIDKEKIEKTILKIYNFLFHFFSIDQLKHINLGIYVDEEDKIFENEKKDIMEDSFAITVSNFLSDGKSYSCVYLNANIYDNSEQYKNKYQEGFFSTNMQEYGALIHEYGHILSNYLYAFNDIEHKNSYNKTIDKNCDELRKTEKTERPHQYFTDEFNFNFAEILLKKIIKTDFNKMTSVQRKLALWTALPSIYSRSIDPIYRQIFELEYFAEAFAYWMLTPNSLKNYYWELIDSSFWELLKKVDLEQDK